MGNEIENIWKSDQSKEETPSSDFLLRIYGGRSKSIVESLLRTLNWEHNFNILFSVALGAFLIRKGMYWWLLLAIPLMFAVFTYYVRLMRRIKAVEYQLQVVQYLKEVKTILSAFIYHYKIASWVIMIAAFTHVIRRELAEDDIAWGEPGFFFIVGVFGIAGLIGLATCYIYVYLLYGKKRRKINRLIKAIEKEEAAALTDQ